MALRPHSYRLISHFEALREVLMPTCRALAHGPPAVMPMDAVIVQNLEATSRQDRSAFRALSVSVYSPCHSIHLPLPVVGKCSANGRIAIASKIFARA